MRTGETARYQQGELSVSSQSGARLRGGNTAQYSSKIPQVKNPGILLLEYNTGFKPSIILTPGIKIPGFYQAYSALLLQALSEIDISPLLNQGKNA